ncbi:histone-lysine N-methyltransferase SETDB1-B-like [Melanotaenia boesemani]|uniref:histone-lysine N-methyltransferase SETDB1-B-like n=1 Tax=Melanotaenia boesemani TaxID=1250792 RepID=UPI001C048C9E|nr:histone-lysine N-methyltransferase SETDB1-B-like [Melanotaenia boesemani]XP_041868028.1 histone-lysine N-methyltransferase SETDB1-B-like [Melanotaenia boesemani]
MEVDEVETRAPELQESSRRIENKRKTDSEEERDDDENMSESPCDSISSMHETPSKATKLENGCNSFNLIKNSVVVLTRLPEYKIGALRPPTPAQFYSEDESLSSSDSDMPWESEEDSSDSDFLVFNKTSKSTTTEIIRVPAVPTTSNVFGHSSRETTKVRPDMPEEEIKVDMMVLARRRPMRWQRGKIVEIVTKEDGRLKYKVSFEEKGKCLVSGHHIAFDTRPKVEQLYVGARVVVRCQNNKFRFRPGILSELPSRKNQFRFLVFMDDHTPVYVGLPLFHLVCRPLDDVFDDVPDGPHKCFMKQYLKDWPYPRLNKYRAGQSFNVELNGVQQRCEVLAVDCSLMQIVFQENQRREWIFRGSMRLEHIARFWEVKEREEAKDDSDSD